MIPAFLHPDGMSLVTFATLVATSYAASFITVAFGIGGGGILLAVMATLVPPAALIPTHGIIQVGSNFGRVLVTFRHIFWPGVPAFAIGSILGAAAGGTIVVSLNPAWVQIGVGGFVIWSVVGRAPGGLRDWPLLVGAVSSFLTMFFGATGLFVSTYMKSHNLPRHSHVATQASLMTVQHGIKTITFGLLGFAFANWLGFVVTMVCFGFLGTLTGRLLLNRIDDKRFRFALNAVLIVLSVRLIYAGVHGFLLS